MLSLSGALNLQGISCTFLLPCQLGYESKIPLLILEKNFKIKIVCSKLYSDGPYSDLRTHTNCKSDYYPDTLYKFSGIISDNLTWISAFNNNSILLAQFIWEKYFDPNLPQKALEDKINNFKFIFGFKYFSQNYLTRQSNFQQIPLLDYWGLSKYRFSTFDNQVFLSWSGAEDINKLTPANITEANFPIIFGLENYLSSNNRPLGIICRPGLGSILECLSANIVPILLQTEDVELASNREIALSNNWAISIEKFQELGEKGSFEYLEHLTYTWHLPDFCNSKFMVENYILKALGG